MTPEQLVLFVLVVLAWLGGALLRWLRGRAEPPAPPEERRRREPPGLRYPVEEAVVAPAPLAPRAPAPALPPRAPGDRRRRVFVAGPGDLRRAIVLMTVLGPCRALEREHSERPH
jgi:hypothetical protein